MPRFATIGPGKPVTLDLSPGDRTGVALGPAGADREHAGKARCYAEHERPSSLCFVLRRGPAADPTALKLIHEATGRQVVLTSHHELVARSLVDLLLPPPGRTLTGFDFDAFSPDDGPRFQCLPATPSSDVERENDDRALFAAILGEGLAQLGLDGRGTLRLPGRGEPATV